MKIMVTSSKRSHSCTAALNCPWPCTRPPLAHASARASWTVTGKSGSVSCGVTDPFSESWCAWGFVCTLQESVSPVLTCLLRNLYAGQEATVTIGYGTIDWFQVGKGVHQGCILSPCLFNLSAEYIMWNTTGLDEPQAGIKTAGEISITSDMQMTHPYGRKWRRTKGPPDESERKRVKKLA